MHRGMGPALAALLALPAAAHADVRVSINPASSSSTLNEEERLNLSAYPAVEGARVILKFGEAAAGECASEPGADPRPVVADQSGEIGVDAKAVAADAGLVRACAWEVDGAGAVTGRGQQTAEVLQQFADAAAALDVTRAWRGVPMTMYSTGAGKRGRVLQTALLTTPCPASAPDPGAAGVVRWLGDPSGRRLGSNDVELQEAFTVTAAGSYQLCSWVGERAGDPAPEATGSDAMTIVGGRARTSVALMADRSQSDGFQPVRWTGSLVGVFAGTAVLEARKVAHTASGAVRGTGPWRRIASVALARQRTRQGAPFGLAGSVFLRFRGRTALPAAIGRQCGNQARIAQVRLRFGGTTLARPSRSKVIELPGSLGGC